MKPSSHVAAAQRAPSPPPSRHSDPPRRNVLAALLAVVIGGIVSMFPFVAGGLVLLDPILKRKPSKGTGDGHSPGADKLYLRVASLGALPEGVPQQVPVISDLADAWNREVNQPIGAVYLIREGEKVTAFNAICPHAGCFVAFAAERSCFQCPCHTSSFNPDGSRILPSPSPRDMDTLPVEVRGGDIYVQFMNFYPGKAAPEVKE